MERIRRRAVVAIDGDIDVTSTSETSWRRHGAEGTPSEIRHHLTDGTVPGAARGAAESRPTRTALVIDDVEITHAELDVLAGRCAADLRLHGVDRGQRVLLCGPSSVELVAAYLAVLRLGATAVFVGVSATAEEVGHLLDDASVSLALLAPSAGGAAAAADAARVPVRELVDIGGSDAAPVVEIAAQADDVAILAYTSGTTGVPKGVPLTHANLLASIRAATEAWRWSPEDVLVHALPLTHQHGLSGVHAALVHASATVVRSRFDPDDLVSALVARRGTVLFAVPTIYERLLERRSASGADLSSLRLLISGSAPMSPALFDRVEAAFGQPPLERYGTTETGLDVSNLYDGPRRPGAVGLPLPGVELRIIDGDDRDVAGGHVGEIVLRGPQVFAGYWRRPDETGAAFLDDGWFRTGDLGRTDPDDGYLVITGRSKDLIISGGLNVYPREVELALEEHPTVRQAAVLGVPSVRWGEEVCALVVVEEGFDASALEEHARARLAPYKRPKRVVVVRELPFIGVGKLARGALPALLAREQPDAPLVSRPDA